MEIILTPFMYAAACGLALSIIGHVSVLVGLPSLLGQYSNYLFFGIFVVWLPTVFVATSLAKDFKQKDFWNATLRGCPNWMKYTVYFFFGYAIFNFILCAVITAKGGSTCIDIESSGHPMAFYSMAMAVLYSAIHVKERDETRRCLNGHPVSPSAKFCEKCGATVIEQENYK